MVYYWLVWILEGRKIIYRNQNSCSESCKWHDADEKLQVNGMKENGEHRTFIIEWPDIRTYLALPLFTRFMSLRTKLFLYYVKYDINQVLVRRSTTELLHTTGRAVLKGEAFFVPSDALSAGQGFGIWMDFDDRIEVEEVARNLHTHAN